MATSRKFANEEPKWIELSPGAEASDPGGQTGQQSKRTAEPKCTFRVEYTEDDSYAADNFFTAFGPALGAGFFPVFPISIYPRGSASLAALPVGFYKRGCQVKTLLLSREEGIFFGHPAQLAARRTLS
jgi:hypothetical protein